MLTLYRRHLTTGYGKDKTEPCPHAKDRFYRRCACPVWIIGTAPDGKYHRHTLNTVSWAAAEDLKRAMETGKEVRPRITIHDALKAWQDALLSAKRGERTVRQVHGAMARKLEKWAAHAGYTYLDQLTLAVLDQHIGTWGYASTTHRSRIDLMRGLFKFAKARKWVKENPASGLIKPEEDQEPTLPFTVDEEAAIFAAAVRFRECRPNSESIWAVNAETSRALLYVLRWTGLRASDAVLFESRKIHMVRVDGREVAVYDTYQKKTGEWVMCPLPPDVVGILRAAPRLSDRTFIPSKESGHSTDPRGVSNSYYEGYLCKLGALSGVDGVRAHRFRDTFAVRLLEAGKPLEIVSALLGHRSIKTTEKHYSPWVRSRAEALAREVSDMWITNSPSDDGPAPEQTAESES
jgi:integrase/recombinase XerD